MNTNSYVLMALWLLLERLTSKDGAEDSTKFRYMPYYKISQMIVKDIPGWKENRGFSQYLVT